MAGTWQMGEATAANVWDMGSTEEIVSSLSISSVGEDGVISDGETGIVVSGTLLNTVTSAIIETTDGTYQSDVTASYSAGSGSLATFNHTRGDTPLTTTSYQLRLRLTDGVDTATFNLAVVEPAAGEQVTELSGTLILTAPESVFAPYTGPDPVSGDQFIVPVSTDAGAPITPNSDSTVAYDYTGFDPVPNTDSHAIEWWSSDGVSRVWSSGTITINEPTTPPSGTITFGTISKTDTSASVPFSYSSGDADSFEYSLDGGAWTTATSPISLSGLTANTLYSIEIRAVNIGGTGANETTTFTTEAGPAVPQGTITVGGILVTETTASIPFSYDDIDATSFEHSTDGGSIWNTVTSPISRTGLTADTEYTGKIRPVNATGTGTEVTYVVKTLAASVVGGEGIAVKNALKQPAKKSIKQKIRN